MLELIDILSKLPGVEVTGHILDNNFDTIKSGWGGPIIFLHIDEVETDGLFFLTRCLDKRYFQHGHVWRIELSCSDALYGNGDRPITYQIFRPLTGIESEETIQKEYSDLVDNMVYHFHHLPFMNLYRLDRSKFLESRIHWTTEAWQRKEKLHEIGI